VQDGASADHAEFLSHATQAAILAARLAALPPRDLGPKAWDTFALYFFKVTESVGFVDLGKLLALVGACCAGEQALRHEAWPGSNV
jgi:hypothetical protein